MVVPNDWRICELEHDDEADTDEDEREVGQDHETADSLDNPQVISEFRTENLEY